MAELKTLTINGVTYDSFVDKTARVGGGSTETTEVVYTYDGDIASEDRTWLYNGSDKKRL